MFLSLLVKNHIEIDLLTLKMTFNHQNSTRNSLFNQNGTKKRSTSHEKGVLHFFLFFFLKIIVFFTF